MSPLPPRLLGDDPLLRCVAWRCVKCGMEDRNPALVEGSLDVAPVETRSYWKAYARGHGPRTDSCDGQLLLDLEPVGVAQAVAQSYDNAVAGPQWSERHTSGDKKRHAMPLAQMHHLDPEAYERVLAKLERNMDGDPYAASLVNRRRAIDADNARDEG